MRVVQLILMWLTVVVCMNAGGEKLSVPGDYASIQDAIDAAAPGDIVEVAAGVYEERLIVRTAIELRGSGSDSTIVRGTSKRGELLKVKDATSGVISGFKFEHSDTASLNPDRKLWPDAVEIKNSSVEIRNCILGPSAGCGIVLCEESNSSVIECRAEGNSQAGIFVRNEGTTATLLRNECINNEWGGICLTKGSRVVAEENTCFNNGRWGVMVLGRDSSIVLRNSVLSGNRGPGVLIQNWANGVIEDNTCRENDDNGIAFKKGSNGTVTGNLCEKNLYHGILVHSLGVNVEVRNNTCNGNEYNGIAIFLGAGGDIEGNICSGNTWCGIIVGGWFTNPVVKNNECSENAMYGIVFNCGATGRVEGNVCRKNKRHGILVEDENTEPDIGQNVYEDNGGEGIAREEGDPVSRQNQIDEEEAGCLLAGEHFDEIEKIAGWLRQHKCRYSGGGWELASFYEGLKKGCGDISPKDREAFTALIERWKKAYPESVTPLITQAEVHSQYGWDARGGGYADTVTDHGWKIFRKELELAQGYLLEAEALNGNDPNLYTLMIDVCKCLDYSDEKLQAMFDKGVAIDVDYFPLYFSMAWNLTPRWGGGPGELERFAEKVFDRTQKEYGHTMYALIAGSLASHMGAEDFSEDHFFDWEKIDKGYTELVKAFPESNYYLNQHCLMACIYHDQEKAKNLFDKIARNVDESVWNGRERFRKWKPWAYEIGPAPYPAPSYSAIDSSPGAAILDALPNDVKLLYTRIMFIGGAIVFTLLLIAIIFILYSASAQRPQPPSLPKEPVLNKHEDDGTTSE